MNIQRLSSLLLVPLLTFSAGLCAQEQDLTDLDLATLMSMDVKVMSATRREQATSDASAAVYVITREDIRRSGATTLPDVLRMAPGVQVAQIKSRAWTVTARGFHGRFASKLLVMVDGRNIYTPIFSGVIWEEQGIFLDEIERIEIVRGPGGALWGTNAVNGVINIITRKAEASRGLHARAGTGTNENQSAALSYGGSFDSGDYRVYVDHNETESLERNGAPLLRTQAGWRLDRSLAEGSFTFQGNFRDNDFGSTNDPDLRDLALTSQVGNVLANWQKDFGAGQIDLRSYYSWTHRGAPGKWDDSATGLDAQFNIERIGRHLITSGLGYRYATDEMKAPSAAHSSSKLEISQHQWNVYAQDEIHFFQDDVRIILGAKLEDLKFTGLAFQPTLRGLWQVTDSHTVWLAGSRAVRTPSRVELHTRMELGANVPGVPLVLLLGDETLEAEDLRAYELGWRFRPHQTVSFDLALYRNDYERLIGGAPLPPVFEAGPAPRLVLPSAFANIEDTRVEGAELVAEWAATDWLNLEAQGTWQDTEADNLGFFPGQIDPKEMYALRAQIDLPRDVELDLAWRSVSRLAGLNIPGYDSLNVRAGWRPVDSIELSLSVENLFDNEHIESSDDLALVPGATLGRNVFARVVWQPKL